MAISSALKKRAKTVALSRPGATSTTDGFRVDAAPTNTNILAVIQIMSAKELRNVPEGQNTLEWYSVWALSEVRVKDVITYNGNDYTIQRATERPEGEFWKASAVKVDDAP